jgi:hypothetical protein
MTEQLTEGRAMDEKRSTTAVRSQWTYGVYASTTAVFWRHPANGADR